jgi:hypothetical protein
MPDMNRSSIQQSFPAAGLLRFALVLALPALVPSGSVILVAKLKGRQNRILCESLCGGAVREHRDLCCDEY